MARIKFDMDGFNIWLAEKPASIRELAARVPPDRLYLLTSSGHRVVICSYVENGTVTVAVTGEYNLVKFDRRVFGIAPEDLKECDFPGSDEPLGTMLTDPDEIEAHLVIERERMGFPPRRTNG